MRDKIRGETIRSTVSAAQELLCSLAVGADRKTEADDRDACYFDYWTERWRGHSEYPKSLGELCLEVAEDGRRKMILALGSPPHGIPIKSCATMFHYRGRGFIIRPGDAQNLSQFMYFKRKSHCVGDGIYDNAEYFQDKLDESNRAD